MREAPWTRWSDWYLVGTSILILGGFGLLTLVSALATLLHWRAWRLWSRASASGLAVYGLNVLLLGHGEDVGGTAMFLFISGASLAVSALGFTLPALESRIKSERPGK